MLNDFLQSQSIRHRTHEPLAPRTTFGVGGPADWWVEPEDFRRLSLLMRFLSNQGVPWVVMGRGANILISDEGYRGVVIHLSGRFRNVRVRPPHLFVGAAASLGRAAWVGIKTGLAGLEKMLAVPSSVGGALIMNAGCYGQEISQVLEWVLLMDPKGRTRLLRAADLAFGYRTSPLRDKGIVCFAGLCLNAQEEKVLLGRARDTVRKRQANLPPGKSAGSVFKNPPGFKARELIGACGLGGTVIGGAKISNQHPNFILNVDWASAGDILDLIRLAKGKVFEKHGVLLEEEVRYLGIEPPPFPHHS